MTEEAMMRVEVEQLRAVAREYRRQRDELAAALGDVVKWGGGVVYFGARLWRLPVVQCRPRAGQLRAHSQSRGAEMNALDLTTLTKLARTDDNARHILADMWHERGRDDVARLWADQLPEAPRKRARLDKLTKAQTAAMAGWATKWIEIGLSTERADRPLFEAAAAACYRAANLQAPPVIWCPSPLVVVRAGSIATHLIAQESASGGAVDDAVGGAVGGAVYNDFNRAGLEWWRYMGGQFWVGGWYWLGSPSTTSFILDVAGLRIDPELELAARAYAATAMSACWWWPHSHFVMVSERPSVIEFHDAARQKLKRVQWEGWEVEK